jgi:hypothetical protein
MPTLHLDNVPQDMFERIHQLAGAHKQSAEVEALRLLRLGLQAELLADLGRHSFTAQPEAARPQPPTRNP